MTYKRFNTRYEYVQETMASWLKSFADTQGEKLLKDSNTLPDEIKNANRMDNILDILDRNKKKSVEAKVLEYRRLVGLDLLETEQIKEGGQTINSRIALSVRDKVAQQDTMIDHKALMERIKQYITQVIHNRNGAIVTPAIIDQLEHYIKVDKDWLRANYDELEDIIDAAKKEFQPKNYNNSISINDLTRTDDQSKGEKEILFAPPKPQLG